MCKFNCKKNVYWVRHGESLSNVSKLGYEIVDPGLTPMGYTQCKELKKYLEFNKIIKDIDLIVVSPLERTLETCDKIINHNYSIPIISLDEIREHIDYPCHKRKSISKKKSQYKFVNFNQITNDDDFMYLKFAGNEPKTNVNARCKWFVRWLKNRKEKNILVITHGNFLLPMFDIIDAENKNFFSNCEIRKTTI